MLFTVDGFIGLCQTAVGAVHAEKNVRELVAEAISDPGRVMAELPKPEHAGFEVLHRAPNLTILNFSWAPWMCFKPHNHCMWSVVGIFSGREDNVFWRRTANGLEAAAARSLGVREVTLLGSDIIHSVVNPIGKLTRAIHVYGGDFFKPPLPRSEWDPETLIERPWDMDDTRRLFDEAESRADPASSNLC